MTWSRRDGVSGPGRLPADRWSGRDLERATGDELPVARDSAVAPARRRSDTAAMPRILPFAAALAFVLAALPAQKPKPYVADLEALFADVEANYPFFDSKGIRPQWNAAKKPLLARAKVVRSDPEFVLVVQDAIAALRDGHAFLVEVKPKLAEPEPEYLPGVAFLPATKGRVAVMASTKQLADELPVGAVVSTIDGKPARQVLDGRAADSWRRGGPFSSPQRAALFEYRMPLRGKKGEKHVFEVDAGKGKKKVEVTADQKAEGWPHSYHLPAGLQQAARSVSHAELPGGHGYVYLRRIDESAADGLRAAVAAHLDAKGWVVDLRGNSGGGYDDGLLDAVKGLKGKVVGIVDAGCISAGETFARDLVNLVQATLIGETTAGSSTQKKKFALPSGIATVQYSVKSRVGPKGVPIEFHGVKPDVVVEVDPEELRAGKNSAIERALELLAK